MKSFLKFLVFACLISTAASAQAVRIKDLVTIEGVRENSLVGYGLVVGLDGSGDSLRNSPFTEQILGTTLERLGVNVTGEQYRAENVAAVIVTATLPPFARTGMMLDVTVSAIGDAKSLRGGTLVMAPLKAPDGEIYVVAQGNIVGAGYIEQGQASEVKSGVPTVGIIPSGGRVEREVGFELDQLNNLQLALKQPDFSTAAKIETVINSQFSGKIAFMRDPTSISVEIPRQFRDQVSRLVAEIEGLRVQPDSKAKVVLDQKTGTIVFNSNVKLSEIALAHNEVTVKIEEAPMVSQPNPFAEGQTILVPRTDISISQDGTNSIAPMKEASNLADLVDGFNALGVDAQSMIDIIKTIHASGALHADLIVQ